jgi:hypothetical protein
MISHATEKVRYHMVLQMARIFKPAYFFRVSEKFRRVTKNAIDAGIFFFHNC